MLPCFTNREILEVHDAQFCFSHGLAIAAHRIPPGPRWQDPAVVFDPSVMALMNRVSLETHPTYFQSISADISSRPSRVEVRARGLRRREDVPEGNAFGGSVDLHDD